jgi:hypothetical protein
MTLEQWEASMNRESYGIERGQLAKLAIAYKIDPPQHSLSMRIPTVIFRVYYKGEERSEHIYMMTDVGQRNPSQWYPLGIKSIRVVSRVIKVEVMAKLGPYTLDFDFG